MNVGLLEVRRFQPPDLAGDTIAAALGFLANADAVIVDVGNCRGGSASETINPVRLEFFAGPDGSVTRVAFTDEDRLREEYRKDG